MSLSQLTKLVPVELCLLKQLDFESVDSREDSIREAEAGTFNWMLDDNSEPTLLPHMTQARQTFLMWLKSGSGVFHISGKAGAGRDSSTVVQLSHS